MVTYELLKLAPRSMLNIGRGAIFGLSNIFCVFILLFLLVVVRNLGFG